MPCRNRQFSALSLAVGLSCVLALLTAFLFVSALPVHAQQQDVFGVQDVQEGIALGGEDIRIVIARIINIFLGLLGIITVGLMIYGGFVIMTSGGVQEKVEKGRKVLINATIGLAIILTSFAITQFFISRFGRATGLFGPGGQGAASGPGFDNFAASGALGSGIIKDVFPLPNARSVKRNTSIMVTFAEPMNPGSIIENTNSSCWTQDGSSTNNPAVCDPDGNGDIDGDVRPYFGDCITPDGQAFDQQAHCDHVRTDRVLIFVDADGAQNPIPVAHASALTMYEDGDERNAYTFAFKPFSPLGNDVESVLYTVDLTNEIEKADGIGAFDGEFYNRYSWSFETGTELDFDPPHVVSVYPLRAPRNSVVQLTFNEPIDISVQGPSGPDSPFNHVIFGDARVAGEWRLTNGFRTLEFLSDQACGQNSCGDITYCLPMPSCVGQGPECFETFDVLARTAQLANPDNGSFESVPFSGVMDASWNALNGRSGELLDHDNNQADGRPPFDLDDNGNVLVKTIGGQERNEDNFWWRFVIENRVDRTPPRVESLIPDIDTSRVPGDAPITITFSEAMWMRTLTGLTLEEYPANVQGLDDIWYATRSHQDDAGRTVVDMRHRDFGPNGLDLYYFPAVLSSVKDAQQNCFYPGQGPVNQETNCTIDGDGNLNNCTPVNEQSVTDTSCVTAVHEDILLQPNVSACREALRSPDVSPVNENPAPEQEPDDGDDPEDV